MEAYKTLARTWVTEVATTRESRILFHVSVQAGQDIPTSWHGTRLESEISIAQGTSLSH